MAPVHSSDAFSPPLSDFRRKKGRQWKTVGIGLYALASVILSLTWGSGFPEDFFWVIPFVSGSFAYVRGRKFMAPTAETVIFSDSRPPVLYLRSFNDDSAASASPESAAFLRQFWQGTEEEQLARA